MVALRGVTAIATDKAIGGVPQPELRRSPLGWGEMEIDVDVTVVNTVGLLPLLILGAMPDYHLNQT